MEHQKLFVTEKTLLADGFKVIAEDCWAKGRKIFIRCESCSLIDEVPFGNVDIQNQSLSHTCTICSTDSVQSKLQRRLKKW